ncbi:MAG: hypothetical protein IPJ42_14170 [Betaproteobacteria bacterium]|nr:hypothetical protein [Betaproteobacteria bacterium]
MATLITPSFDQTLIARAATGLYNLQLGSSTTDWALEWVNGGNGTVEDLVNQLFVRDFGTMSDADVAAMVVENVNISEPANVVADAIAYVAGRLGAVALADKGAEILSILKDFSALASDPVYGSYATAFNAQISAAVAYAQVGGNPDMPLDQPESMEGKVFNVLETEAAGAAVMRLTGDQEVRLDFGNSMHQIRGLDLDGDGTIEADGMENNFAYLEANVQVVADNHSGFAVVDAYARNPLNINDVVNNFSGQIYYDGTGFFGDGKSTNGNIFLGGLAEDTALGGIGNDFFAGGGNGGGINGTAFGDYLSGGRNADFLFAELSLLSSTDGNNNTLMGGTTSDDTVADAGGTGGVGTQDNDWVLLEVSDDDEPFTMTLNEGTNTNYSSTASGTGFWHSDIESLNASGNLYGFLDDIDTVIGARATDSFGDEHTAGDTNYGRGSTGQLRITGSAVGNAIIGGYDNDRLDGGAGNDLLMGGDLQFLIANRNNPNLLDAKGGLNLTANSAGLVNDGKDQLIGGAGNDNIVLESDGGSISGDADTAPTSGNAGGSDTRNYAGPRASSQGDALWLTDFSMGRLVGATDAGEATAQQDALAQLTTDQTYRVDLGNDGAINFRNYGGTAAASQDNTNYKAVTSSNGTVPRVGLTGMETVNTTGLGAADYKAAGSNTPDLVFANQQNYFGLNTAVDLRGNAVDNVLLANNGNDALEGRGGDDVLSGGSGNDRFVAAFGDGVDWVARPVDANGDNLWDTSGGLVVSGGLAWGQDFRPAAAATAGTTTLVVDLGTTVLNGVDTFVATFQVRIDGVDFGSAIPIATLAAAKTTAELAAIVNPAYQSISSAVSVVATSATTLEVRAVDTTPGDGKLPVIGTTAQEGFFISGQASGVGTFQAKGSILGSEGTNLEDDRLVIKSYEDRSINLGIDQTKFETSQAAAMVANFTEGGSQLVETQGNRLYLSNVREGDTVSVTINGAVYSYTLKAGERADQAATGLANAVNRFLDVNSSSGRVVAAADLGSFGDAAEGAAGVDLAGVLITQANVLNSMTYMGLSATVTRTDGAAPFGSVATHNQSNTEVQMLGFDGRNGALFSQDATLSPVVLFQGRNAGTTTNSLLLTAKNAGGALNGMDAWLNAAGDAFINGDDLLYGGTGNDVIGAGTGDDRVIMSKGADTVDGGGNSLLPDDSVFVYQDVLQAEEGTFGTGTSFKVVLDGALYAAGAGKGTVTAMDAKGVATANVTTFSNIELVRVLENNRNSSLDLKALSDNVAAAVGTNGLAAEGLDVLLTTTPSTTYSIDKNNNGAIAASEITTATAVLGVENITTGNANDRVTLDQTQATANNVIDLGAQQDNSEALTLREGADVVTVNHADVTNNGVVDATDEPLRPTLTLAVQGTSLSQLTATAGALGKASFTDTFKNVEVVNLVAAATSTRYNDVLDAAGTGGATVNYGAAVTVGKSLGGQLAPVTTVAQLDANTLDSGGVAPAAALGSEWVTVQGITLLERVTGSTGADRVIVADDGVMQQIQTKGSAFDFGDSPVRTAWDVTNTTASGFSATPTQWSDQGLYQFNLGGGVDTLDYSQESMNVVVSVDTTADDVDLVFVDSAGGNGRIDYATSVERYLAGGTATFSWIDLAAATVATTIQFSHEAASNVPANDAQEPNGNDGTTTSGLTRAAQVRSTADNTVFATFVDRTGAGIVPAALWTNVQGSNLAETVIFTDNETAAAHNLRLQAGANKVDYSLLTATVTANIGATNVGVVALEQIHAVNGDAIRHNFSTDAVANRVTLVGTTRAGDQLDVSALVNGTVVRANPQLPTTSQVDPQFHVVNLATGEVTESIFGEYTPVGAAVGTAVSRAFVTNVVGFENASNGGDADVVHMLGDNGRNSLAGGTAADVIYGSRGTAGDGSADVGAGNRGDNLTGNAGADLFWYAAETESPGGTIGAGDQAAANFSNDEDNVINSRDTITDFTTTVDKLVFVVNDTYDSIKGSAAVPANLGAPLLAAVPVAAVFVAGNATVDIGKSAASAGTVNDFDNYDIDTTLATAAIGDVILRVGATGGADLIDASAGLSTQNLDTPADDGLEVRVVYTAATQSQAGGFDQIINFLSGEDKIDLSFLKLARYESSKTATGVNYDTNTNNVVDAIELGAIRALGAAPVFAVNGVAPNLFLDGAIYRPIATQTLTDGNGDPSTTVFIDANGDGNYVPTDDMVVVLVGVNAPVNGDFVFDQYGGAYGG